MKFELKKSIVVSALFAVTAVPAIIANAGGTITFGEDKSVSVGFGMRGGYNATEDAAPNGTDYSNNFSLDSARLYFSGSLNKYIKGMLNTEKDIAGQGFQAIDANVQLAVLPELTIWLGRFLSPSDRANLAGPYYSLGGGYWSGIASRYGFNGGFIGRDDGAALVGTALDGKLSYSVGAFEGNTEFKIAPASSGTVGTRTGSDDLMYAGRLQYDFWDAEPGYYGTGNYLGAKDILAIGIAARTQGGGAYSTTATGATAITAANSKTGDYNSYSIDFLLEKKDVGPGAVSVEAAYYDYDTDGVFLTEQGQAYSAGAGYIFNQKMGWGQFQPFVRYQKFDADLKAAGQAYEQVDLGTAYIIDGYNAQVSAFYSNADTATSATATKDVNSFSIKTQFQF